MDHSQLSGLLSKPHIHFDRATEKTDGMTHVMGHDEHGFYTQSSGSGKEKMRHPDDYLRRAQDRGSESKAPAAFAHIHKELASNAALRQHLADQYHKTGKDTKIRGEVFYKPFGHQEKNGMRFVGTSYDPSRMGHTGSYVVHSKLPENHHVPIKHVDKWSTPSLKFDHDIPNSHRSVPPLNVSRHQQAFSKLNHDLLKQRTKPSNKAAKTAESAKMRQIAMNLSRDVDKHISKHQTRLPLKWGNETEGHVFHPTMHNPHAPRFKVTSQAFRQFKTAKHTLGEEFICEGGNVKVGDVHATHLDTSTPEKRHQVRQDVSDAMTALHHHLKQHEGHELFGPGAHHIASGEAFTGGTKHLFSHHIPDAEYSKHKPAMGDIDVHYHSSHKDALEKHLKPGLKMGPYTVAGTRKHGTEHSALMRHNKTGEVHQFDFEATDNLKDNAQRRSSDWEDTKRGFKGKHHKQLLNAVGLSRYKLSPKGIQSRAKHGAVHGFGDEAKQALFHKHPADIGSFHGLVDAVKHSKRPSSRQKIYDKFKERSKTATDQHALKTLANQWRIRNEEWAMLSEETQGNEHHTTVVPMVGFSPISHMGHAEDLGSVLRKLPGEKHIGISRKGATPDISDRLRHAVFKHQLAKRGVRDKIKTHQATSAGAVIGAAYHSAKAPKGASRHLHIVVGADRVPFANNLKDALENGRIPEMKGKHWDKITVHIPEHPRASGMSGTKMRAAAAAGNTSEFSRHVGLDDRTNRTLLHKVQKGIRSGSIPLKR